MPKQNEANAIYTDTDTDTDTVTDTDTASHSLTRAREKQSATADCKESVPAVRHAPAPWQGSRLAQAAWSEIGAKGVSLPS